MQTLNNPGMDSVGKENFPNFADFPTEEELIAALESSLEQSPWLPRSTATALDATSRDLARHWQELGENYLVVNQPERDEHYLAGLVKESELPQELPVEPDFLADFARFLTNRLTIRLRETHQVQHQLLAELAKFGA